MGTDSHSDSKPDAEHVHIAQTRISTPYFCIGQESISESISYLNPATCLSPKNANILNLIINAFFELLCRTDKMKNRQINSSTRVFIF